ncbi:MAG TPA: sigma-54 dependent transcriptional regulator [Terriglobales bacterium]|nr:sigma-54 dependent transcriptional regulator [Terriglobales bacterium]
METVLLVEDKAELREMLMHALTRMQFQPVPAANVAEALQELRTQRFSAVLTDLKLPVGSGLDVLSAALEEDANVPVIIMTAHGTIPDAVAAMREGAFDFIQKPIDLEHLKHLLTRAIERQQLIRENVVLKEEYSRTVGFPRIIGEDAAMRTVAREMQRIALTDSAVLLLGESGTGKELFARAIHQLSPRAAKPLVSINCAAIPESLIENELFGHERGAFTGADSRRAGKFELAHGGTIFLDEVGELPLNAQAKLLRVLEGGSVERLGGTAPIKTDVRVIAATNKDLEAAMQSQRFRADLFYRLNVFPIHIPSLRDRGDDILALAQHFLERFRRERNKAGLALGADAIAALRGHAWPGNVRELQNVMERACILNDGELRASDLGLAANVRATAAGATPRPTSSLEGSLSEVTARAVESVEKAKIEATLRECKWNKADAAARLGIAYKTLLSKIHAYGLDD